MYMYARKFLSVPDDRFISSKKKIQLKLQVKISLLHRSNQRDEYKVVIGLNNFTIDACAYTSGFVGSMLFYMFASSLQKYPSLLKRCPISVGNI